MEQVIRFCELDGQRIAYASAGEGPLLLVGGRFVTHLEEEWEEPTIRRFFEELAATHRVVRFDRLGAGLSDRALPGEATVEIDVWSLRAVHQAVGLEPAILFAWSSCAGRSTAEYAVRHADVVRKIVFFGACAARDDVPDATRKSLVEFVRTNWALASQMLAGLMAPHASGDEIASLSRYLRRSADAQAAAAFLELDLVSSMRAVLPKLEHPALVLHRRGDRTVPISHGRELASLLPNARFVALAGDSHLPHLDDQREVQRALAGFLGESGASETSDRSPLTRRETEVLRLVAAGLSNREIASSLVLSEHTVHRHVANILRKLAQSTRAAAATHAMRLGLI